MSNVTSNSYLPQRNKNCCGITRLQEFKYLHILSLHIATLNSFCQLSLIPRPLLLTVLQCKTGGLWKQEPPPLGQPGTPLYSVRYLSSHQMVTCYCVHNIIITVDQKIFVLKIIHVKIFRVLKFSRFRFIREIVESSWHLVYYQVSREPGIAHCSRQLDIYLGECGLTRKLIHWLSARNFIFRLLNFCGWSRPRNYFISEIFPMYRMLWWAVCMCKWNVHDATSWKRKTDQQNTV